LMLSGESVADQAILRYTEREKLNGALPGLPTGFKALDQRIDGLMPGLNVFIGATGMGKSWTAASIAGHLVSRGYRGLAITTEMNSKTWIDRVAAYTARINGLNIKRGKLTTAEKIRYVEAMNDIDKKLVFMRGVRPTYASLRATMLNIRMKGDLHFVVIDSASRLVNAGDNIAGETAMVQNALQELVIELELPFIITGQVRGRDIANRAMKMPTINDSFGGSSWEHNADVLVGLYYHHYYVSQLMAEADDAFPEGVFAMRVLKNREGESAADQIIKTKFVGGSGLYELDERKPPLHIARYQDDEETA
jgi:replicative DNA helicase